MASIDSGLLKSNALFGRLDQPHIEELTKLGARKTYKDGEVLVKEGESQTKAFIIEEGEVRRLKRNPNSDEQVELNKLEKGETAGFLHFFAQDPSFATLQSKGESVVWELTRDEFTKWVSSHPEVSLSVMSGLAQTVRNQSKLIHGLSKDEKEENKDVVKVIFFDTKKWVIDAFDAQKKELKFDWLHIKYVPQRLSAETAYSAAGCQVVSCFVNDNLDGSVIKILSELGVKTIAMRCAGFDRVDLKMAEALGITVTRVPAYSPYAVAEHAIALLLTLNRKTHKAYNRTREGNFSLDGLLGFDLYGKTAGVIGTGKIGQCLVNILLGFGCKVLAYDVFVNKELASKVTYTTLDDLYANSDFISLHAPLTPETTHMINAESLKKMKKDVYIVNTSRGGLIDTPALVKAIENDQVGGVALDVYEQERDYFFQDKSVEDKEIEDETLRKLLSLKNVVVTGHQAFFTAEAINNIAKTTLTNIQVWKDGKKGRDHPNAVHP